MIARAFFVKPSFETKMKKSNKFCPNSCIKVKGKMA